MRDRVALPCLFAGGLLVAEAVASPWMEPHWGYHALNVPLSVAVALALWRLLRRDGAAWPKAARVGAWLALVGSGVAVIGGLVPLALEPTGIGESPGIVEGIVHTFTLLLFVGLALVGLAALRPGPRGALAFVGLGAAAAVAMALSGLDSPWLFLAPEALVGVGFAWLGIGRSRPAAVAEAAAS